MPIATPQQYEEMLSSALEQKYAYPAINITSLATANGALKAFSEAKSDGIIQISLGGGEFASGLGIKDSAYGAIILAEAIHRLAEKYPILIGLHTDHCQPKKAEKFLNPLLAESKKRSQAKKIPLFQSHMLDASELPLAENLKLSKKYLQDCTELNIILEVETGIVGGEEDGIDHSNQPSERLYTSPEEMLAVYETLHSIGKFMLAATFGNVHGSYKPGAVQLKPEILKKGQEAVIKKYGEKAKMPLVFHGGSGSDPHQIEETLEYGVVKMNIDTDTQYAFTRPIAQHICENIEGVLKIDGEIGNKKLYDPRSYLKKGEENLCKRLKEACKNLHSQGKTLIDKI